jgi:hypothetical protein
MPRKEGEEVQPELHRREAALVPLHGVSDAVKHRRHDGGPADHDQQDVGLTRGQGKAGVADLDTTERQRYTTSCRTKTSAGMLPSEVIVLGYCRRSSKRPVYGSSRAEAAFRLGGPLRLPWELNPRE